MARIGRAVDRTPDRLAKRCGRVGLGPGIGACHLLSTGDQLRCSWDKRRNRGSCTRRPMVVLGALVVGLASAEPGLGRASPAAAGGEGLGSEPEGGRARGATVSMKIKVSARKRLSSATVRITPDDAASSTGPDQPSGCTRPSRVQNITFSNTKYPNMGKHFLRASRTGWPGTLVLNRKGASERRARLLEGVATKSGFDRDEYPRRSAADWDGPRGARAAPAFAAVPSTVISCTTSSRGTTSPHLAARAAEARGAAWSPAGAKPSTNAGRCAAARHHPLGQSNDRGALTSAALWRGGVLSERHLNDLRHDEPPRRQGQETDQ
ncbi:hypothetical protein DSM104299_04150 [Baekduia alba]|nr:hypothetical protein DSM104299_04150 [Baekduia alba]